MVDAFVKVVGAIASLINAFAWPLVVAWLVLKFAPVIRDFLGNISEGSLKGFGIEATAKRKATEAIVDADISKADLSKNQIQFSPGVGKSSALAGLFTRGVSLNEMRGKTVLWVVDGPTEGHQEIRSLVELGLTVKSAHSVEDARRLLAAQKYDAIVFEGIVGASSDLPLKKLSSLHEQQPQTPLIFYADDITPDIEAKALRNGAFASTEKAFELLGLVISAIQQPRPFSSWLASVRQNQ